MPKEKQMSKAGKKILAAMEEAILYAGGDKSKGKLYKIAPKSTKQIVGDVPVLLKEIRESLDMNRTQFAEAFRFTKYSVRNWESGEREPPEYCIAYLQLISRNPWKAYQELHPEG
jgi:DNA-binding transcriptional regulator YiaG